MSSESTGIGLDWIGLEHQLSLTNTEDSYIHTYVQVVSGTV